jgi:hypothetical protein
MRKCVSFQDIDCKYGNTRKARKRDVSFYKTKTRPEQQAMKKALKLETLGLNIETHEKDSLHI